MQVSKDPCGPQGGRVCMGWCDGVQVCDHNTVCVTRRVLRAETLVGRAASLGAPRVRITGPRTEARQYNRNTPNISCRISACQS